jgi:hypothetical protein
MTSYNFFDFGVTCSTFISLCPNIRNTGLYFYLAFDFFKLRNVLLLRYTNVDLQKTAPHKKEKLTTYYSIKTSNTQGWKLAGAQLPKAPTNLAGYPMCICIRQYHQISGLRLWAVFRRRNVVMGIDVRWVSRGRRNVVSYHKWMTSHNFFDFGVTCSTFIINDILLHQNIKYSGMEISRGPVAQGPYKFGWATRN